MNHLLLVLLCSSAAASPLFSRDNTDNYTNPNDPPGCNRAARTGNWVTVSCDAPGMTSVYDGTPEERWNTAQATYAWGDFISVWKDCDLPQNHDFSESLTNFFHVPGNAHCDDLANDDGCDLTSTCNAVLTSPDPRAITGAGGSFVWNALAAVHYMIKNYQDSLRSAMQDVTMRQQAFVDVFSPKPPNTLIAQIVFTLLAIPFATLGTFFFKNYLRDLPALSGDGLKVDLAHDSVMTLIMAGFVLAKTIISAAAHAEVEFSSILQVTLQTWMDSTDALVKHLFTGSDDALSTLSTLIDGGHFTEGNGPSGTVSTTQNHTASFLQENALANEFYTAAVPLIWTITEQVPVILETGRACDDTAQRSNDIVSSWLSSDDMKSSMVCIDGRRYYVAAITHGWNECSDAEHHACPSNSLSLPRGIDQLDGKTWGSLTKESLVTAALSTFKAKGYINSKPFTADPTDKVIFEAMYNDPGNVPGTVNIPVCFMQEVLNNYQKGDSAAYPCS